MEVRSSDSRVFRIHAMKFRACHLPRSFLVQALERRVFLAGHPVAPLPAFNQPQGAPGTVELERFDTGGEGVSYHDPAGAPDIQPSTDAGGTSYLGSTV